LQRQLEENFQETISPQIERLAELKYAKFENYIDRLRQIQTKLTQARSDE